jgi:hypothetical protein
MANKVSTQLLISPLDLDRVRALALVRTERQAEVARTLLTMGLPSLEVRHARELHDLYKALDAARVDRSSALEVLLKGGMTAEGIVSMDTDAVRRVLNAL